MSFEYSEAILHSSGPEEVIVQGILVHLKAVHEAYQENTSREDERKFHLVCFAEAFIDPKVSMVTLLVVNTRSVFSPGSVEKH